MSYALRHGKANPSTIAEPHPIHLCKVVQAPGGPVCRRVHKALTTVRTDEAWQTGHMTGAKIHSTSGSVWAIHYWLLQLSPSMLEYRFKEMRADLVTDVTDICYWHWFINVRSPNGVAITLGQILQYRGLQVQPAESRTVSQHWQALLDVCAIGATINGTLWFSTLLRLVPYARHLLHSTSSLHWTQGSSWCPPSYSPVTCAQRPGIGSRSRGSLMEFSKASAVFLIHVPDRQYRGRRWWQPPT